MADPNLATHAVAHLLRFESRLAPDAMASRPEDASALGWLVGTESELHEAFGTLAAGPARVWGLLGLYGSLQDAERAYSQRNIALPLLEQACEAWHALLLPIKHWGTSDWLGPNRIGPVFAPQRDSTHHGPVVVTTSAGYIFDERFDLERARDFSRRIVALREQMIGTDGMLLEQNISNVDETREGMTFSLWRDEAAVRAFAYAKGPHREQLDRHRAQPMFDRSSFTRYRVLRAGGTWGGVDPLIGTVEH